MLTIGIDPHKQTHSAVAVNALGVKVAQRQVLAKRDGFGQLLEWARKLDPEHVWVIEDVRHVSAGLERFLIDHGATVVRLPPRLMAKSREVVRERGKSDPIDALAIARAALREGVDTLPTARCCAPSWMGTPAPSWMIMGGSGTREEVSPKRRYLLGNENVKDQSAQRNVTRL